LKKNFFDGIKELLAQTNSMQQKGDILETVAFHSLDDCFEIIRHDSDLLEAVLSHPGIYKKYFSQIDTLLT